ncbi:MAG: hypothetical protein ABFD69_12065 [Candidatus Sumerlaeia bacterium]
MKQVFVALALVAVLAQPVVGAVPSVIDGFDPDVNGTVRALAVQGDGRILLGGDFSTGEGARRHMTRLLNDGTSDSTFLADADGAVLAIAPQADGKILVAGEFTAIDGQARSRIARINADGSLDASFNPGAGANGTVNAVAIQADGKALIGGDFTQVNGVARVAVARLNANGSLDTSFVPANTGSNSSIHAVAVQRNGKIVLGGYFERVGGVIHNRIVRLNADGKVDENFNPGTDANSYVNALVIQPDGKMVLGGTFMAINGWHRRCVARINENGSLDKTFDPGEAADDFVDALALQADGKIIVGGEFSKMGGQTHRGIARLNVDGSVDPGFAPNVDEGSRVYAVTVQPDGKALLGGDFTSVGGTARNRLARLNPDGGLEVTFNITTPTYGIYAMALQLDGKIVGGGLTGGSPYDYPGKLIREYPDGTADTAFNGQTGYNADAFAILVQPDGKMVVCGSYMRGYRSTIRRLNADGTTDTTFQPVTVDRYGIDVFALQPDGKILAGGRMRNVNGVARGGLVRLQPDGTVDTSFNTGSSSFTCRALALQLDGKIVVGREGGEILRLNADGSADTGFSRSVGVSGEAMCFAVQPNGKIIVGGSFIELRSVACYGIMRLHENGKRDPAFGLVQTNLTGFNEIGSIIVQANGQIIIHGMHQITDGVFKWNFYTERLNPDGTIDPNFGYIHENNGDRMGYGLALQPDGKILANCGVRSNLVRYTNPDAATQKLTVGSGTVTWTLGGGHPWPYQVQFEASSDGEHWTPLGWGGAVAGVGYRLGGLKLPTNQNHYVRATGYFAGGRNNGSTWLQRSTARYYDFVQGAAARQWLLAE